MSAPDDDQADGFKAGDDIYHGANPWPMPERTDEFETIHERAHAGKSDPDKCDRGQGCPAFLALTLVLPRPAWAALIACAEIGLEGAHDASSLTPEALDGVEEALRQLRWLTR